MDFHNLSQSFNISMRPLTISIALIFLSPQTLIFVSSNLVSKTHQDQRRSQHHLRSHGDGHGHRTKRKRETEHSNHIYICIYIK